jgi:1-deoxy-D-xylulose-5-phosphate synthase
MAPKDQPETEAMIQWATASGRAVALRYPRDEVSAQPLAAALQPIELGRGEIIREGEKTAVLAYGAEVRHAMEAAALLEKRNGLKITVANARFCKPFDSALLAQLLERHERVITVEDHQLMNGFGSAALEAANELGLDTRKIKRLGIPDQYIQHSLRKTQLAECGLDAEGIAKAALG